MDSRLRGNDGDGRLTRVGGHAPDMVTYRRGERLAKGVRAVDSRLRGNDEGGRLTRVGGHAPDMVTYRRGERLAKGVRAVDSRLRGNDEGWPTDAGGWSRAGHGYLSAWREACQGSPGCGSPLPWERRGWPSAEGGWSCMAMTKLRKPVPALHAPDTVAYRRGERLAKGVRAVDSRLRGNDGGGRVLRASGHCYRGRGPGGPLTQVSDYPDSPS